MSQAELEAVPGNPGAPEDKLVGTTIDGRYEVESVLGEGGMGLVYKAKHIVLQKSLAVKVLRPDVSRDEEIITRFRQEAQSASAIGNQHIIDISDFGALPDQSTYFVMEYLEGVDLTGAIEAGVVEPARVVHIAKQLCQALGAAHEAGIVHRDLKPDNIYLIRRGGDSNFVKVLDFGIAKVGGSSSKLTRAGQVFGTPHYMSPEQCSGSGVDHRTDVYALGIILYEMCTGAVPFDADNLMGILTKHLYEQPVPPRQVVPELPEDLEAVILKAMAKQVEHRYQNMGELYEDLLRVEQGVGTLAREQTASHTLPRGQVGPPSELQSTLDPRAGTAAPSKSRMPLVLGLGALVIAGGGAAAAFLGGNSTPAEEPVTPVAAAPTLAAGESEAPAANDAANDTPTAVQPPVGAAPGEGPAVTVTVGSEPAGAEVWRADELLGNTPFEVPRPEGDARLDLQLRLPGYRSRDFAISSLTDTSVSFALVRSSSRQRRTPRVQPMQEAPMMQPAQMRGRRPSAELLDPWAN
ncbi:MAG: serine/threonine-protein kinase [Myxococcota bacterium]